MRATVCRGCPSPLATAQQLQEAARQKHKEALAASQLAKEERKHLLDAEAVAKQRLEEQERLMREAAKHEENARNVLAIAEQQRGKEILEQSKAAERKLRSAELVRDHPECESGTTSVVHSASSIT